MSDVFADRGQFERLFARLFADLAAEPTRIESLVESGMVICFDVRDPDVEMWIDGRRSPVQTSFGPSELRATLTAGLRGDDLHALLLGTLPLGKALRRRKLRVKGSKLKAMKLEQVLHACQAGYPALAEEFGVGTTGPTA
jgi:putative sterol carrier protein